MLCPKCKSLSKEITSTFLKKNNYIERNRKCSNSLCGNIFTTFEKINLRKIEPRTLWKEHRFKWYSDYIMRAIVQECYKLNKEKNNIANFIDNPGIWGFKFNSGRDGVLNIQILNIKTQKTYFKNLKGLKSAVVRKILNEKDYWVKYKELFNKEVSSDIKKKEKDQFLKSINHKNSGIRSEKYNLEFIKSIPSFKRIYKSRGKDQTLKYWKSIHNI